MNWRNDGAEPFGGHVCSSCCTYCAMPIAIMPHTRCCCWLYWKLCSLQRTTYSCAALFCAALLAAAVSTAVLRKQCSHGSLKRIGCVCGSNSNAGYSPVREEFAELVGGIDENIELRRRLPIQSKHVGGEVVDVHLRERRASRFDARVWADGTAPSALRSSRTVAKERSTESVD